MKRGCTQCGECLNVCPVFQEHRREEFSPKAKRLLLEPVDAGAADLPWEEVKDLARLCAGCGRCRLACARKLSTADLLADVRAAHPHWSQHVWELWIRRMGPLWPTLGRLAALASKGGTPAFFHATVASAAALVDPGGPEPWLLVRPGAGAVAPSRPVVLFSGCTATHVRARWKNRAEALLRAWGYTLLDASGFACCGGTLHHAGQYAAMREVQAQNLRWWGHLGRPRVATFCASCFHGLSAYSGEGGELVRDWKASLVPLSGLLAGAVSRPTPVAPERWGYHQPCHWDADDADMPFLQAALGGMVKGAGVCCGMGGILKMTDPGLSARMAQRCLEGFSPDVTSLLTGCSGCVVQLTASASPATQVYHWLDVVAPL